MTQGRCRSVHISIVVTLAITLLAAILFALNLQWLFR